MNNPCSPCRLVLAMTTLANSYLITNPATAQTNAPTGDPVQQLLQRVDRQEAEIQALKLQLAHEAKTADDGGSAMPPPPKYPTIQFHGFGDIDYAADNRRGTSLLGVTETGGKNTFFLGEFDLFISAQLAEEFSVLSESVLSANLDNEMGVDIERLMLQYEPSPYFNVDLGRFHTALGYYNTAYHHGTWFQNAVGRPSFLDFEDSGGLLPVHMVGASIHGAIPSGSWNLNYFLEGGNGLDYTTNPNKNVVQQVVDNTDSKAVNIAFTAKPDWMPGWQFGAGMYYDHITPQAPIVLPDFDQFIFNGHLVYHNANWEFLTEGYLLDDQPVGGEAHYSPMVYGQISRKFHRFTPYGRFTYYNASRNDALYSIVWNQGANAGVHYGPSLGLRYDISTYVALKAQYDYLIDEGLNDASRLTLQAAFTF